MVITSAGDGPVVIDGTLPIVGPWSASGGGLFTAPSGGHEFLQLFIDGELQVLARYPNAAWSDKSVFFAVANWLRSKAPGVHDLTTGEGLLRDQGMLTESTESTCTVYAESMRRLLRRKVCGKYEPVCVDPSLRFPPLLCTTRLLSRDLLSRPTLSITRTYMYSLRYCFSLASLSLLYCFATALLLSCFATVLLFSRFSLASLRVVQAGRYAGDLQQPRPGTQWDQRNRRLRRPQPLLVRHWAPAHFPARCC